MEISLLLATLISVTRAFYVPGVAPVEFAKSDPVDVRVVKMTSSRTQLPFDYYSFYDCLPAEGVKYKGENLGEVLRGDRIANTPYKVQMDVDVQCAVLCEVDLSADKVKTARQMVLDEYYVHLLVDNLPSATLYQGVDDEKATFVDGHLLGQRNVDRSLYLNNHLNIILHYNKVEDGSDGTKGPYRVVRFEVKPESISSDRLQPTKEKTCTRPDDGQIHALELKQEGVHVTYSYSVTWVLSDVRWASRWDTYLQMSDTQIHWFSIINSLVVISFLTGIISIILIRAVKRDISTYNAADTEDAEQAMEIMEETGWKLVHGDVFRPPPHPVLFVATVGSGLQLTCMAGLTIGLAMLGMLSPSSRGSLLTAFISLFIFFGLVSGYFSARLYRTFRGQLWKRAAAATAMLYPLSSFSIIFLLNFFLWGKASSGALPIGTIVAMVALWTCVCLPLTYVGFYFGFRKQPYEHPTRINQIPRQIPEQQWYNKTISSCLLAGLLPFGSVFIELFYIFTAIWENKFYYLFGFLFIVFFILMISTSQISIVMVYFQLCNENYHWWWRTIITAGSPAFYMFFYSIFYFYSKLQITEVIPAMVYFGNTFVFVFTFFLINASVGFYAAFTFIRSIFSQIKID